MAAIDVLPLHRPSRAAAPCDYIPIDGRADSLTLFSTNPWIDI